MLFLMNTLQVRWVSYEIVMVSYEICLWFVIWLFYQKCYKRNNNRYVVYPEIYLFFWLSIHENKLSQTSYFILTILFIHENTFRMKHVQVCSFFMRFCQLDLLCENIFEPHGFSYEHITGATSFIWKYYHFIWNLFIIL